jgi:hypothetical protein
VELAMIRSSLDWSQGRRRYGENIRTISCPGSRPINYENPILEGGVAPEPLQSFPLTVNGAPRSSVAVAIMMPGVTTGGATAIEGFMNQSGMVSLQTDFDMSPDITSEVKVLSANYDAQYGDSTSGQQVRNSLNKTDGVEPTAR